MSEKKEYCIYIQPLYENWSEEQAKENIRKAQEENENILEELIKRIRSVEQQLQTYKDKEDKLKQILLKYKRLEYIGMSDEAILWKIEVDLQILNEGGKQ